jgi:hypothetical protein
VWLRVSRAASELVLVLTENDIEISCVEPPDPCGSESNMCPTRIFDRENFKEL